MILRWAFPVDLPRSGTDRSGGKRGAQYAAPLRLTDLLRGVRVVWPSGIDCVDQSSKSSRPVVPDLQTTIGRSSMTAATAAISGERRLVLDARAFPHSRVPG